jgi:hypothetical protein
MCTDVHGSLILITRHPSAAGRVCARAQTAHASVLPRTERTKLRKAVGAAQAIPLSPAAARSCTCLVESPTFCGAQFGRIAACRGASSQPASSRGSIPLPRVNDDPTALTTALLRSSPVASRSRKVASIPVQCPARR